MFVDQPKRDFEVSVSCVEEFGAMLSLVSPESTQSDASSHEGLVEFLMAFCVGRVTGLCAMLAPPQEADAAVDPSTAYADHALSIQQALMHQQVVYAGGDAEAGTPGDVAAATYGHIHSDSGARDGASALLGPHDTVPGTTYIQQMLEQNNAMQVRTTMGIYKIVDARLNHLCTVWTKKDECALMMSIHLRRSPETSSVHCNVYPVQCVCACVYVARNHKLMFIWYTDNCILPSTHSQCCVDSIRVLSMSTMHKRGK